MTDPRNNPGCIGFLLGIKPKHAPAVKHASTGDFAETSPGEIDLAYEPKEHLLTAAERSFFGVLQQVCGDSLLIFSKVRMSDLIEPPKGHPNWRTLFNYIKSKHVDFVLCDSKTLATKVVIELDDQTHNRPKTQKRDRLVNDVFNAAGMPLLRVKAAKAYNPRELAESIQRKFRNTDKV